MNALAWLANALGARGLKLAAGDLVMSGAMSQLLPTAVGDHFIARYTTLGAVELKVVA